MAPTEIEILATVLFVIGLSHTFLVKQFQSIAAKFPHGSVGANFFHLMGEVEVVFGFWAGLLIITLNFVEGRHHAVGFLEGLDFTEPAFVFVIMTIASTRPVLHAANIFLRAISSTIPINKDAAFYATALIIGPLLGSFITEPAAMTVTALTLKEGFYDKPISNRLKYMTLGLLFVNVSIGGTLTSFAAPPVLMVAGKWNWDSMFMLTHFGWKASLAVALSACLVTAFNFRELSGLQRLAGFDSQSSSKKVPLWVMGVHLLFLTLVVMNSHHMVIFLGLFLFFLGVVTCLQEFNDPVKLRESLLVGFFLAGLVVLGGFQRWWLEPFLSSVQAFPLFVGATCLTAITDNAALTYLGSQVPNLADISKYALVAGSVVGGGLTVIANAPNPAGYGILNSSFGEEGISPLYLFLSALGPTIIAFCMFWFLP